VKTPNGLKLPAGSYISWANQGERLLDKQDVRFLADNINAAVADAHRTTSVPGPTLVYSRESMQWQIDHASPDHDINEWLDEQAGSMVKWPVPILSATRLEWLPRVQSGLFVLQAPSHLSTEHLAAVARLIRSGHPVALVGSLAGGIDETLLRLAGLRGSIVPVEGQVRLCKAANRAPELVRNVPLNFDVFCRTEDGPTSTNGSVIYTEEGSPALTLGAADGTVLWDAPILRSAEGMPLSQIWGNTGAPYALAAGALNELLRRSADLHVGQIDLKETMNIAAWRTKNGVIHVMAANLEEGLRDDADLSRHATLAIPKSWRAETWKDAWTGRRFSSRDGWLPIDLPQASSILLESSQ
jgi:hypothetical protein